MSILAPVIERCAAVCCTRAGILVVLFVTLACGQSAWAQEPSPEGVAPIASTTHLEASPPNEETAEGSDEPFDPFHIGPLTWGGALRASYIYGGYPSGDGPSRGSSGGNVELDTFRLELKLEYDLDEGWGKLIGDVQYRWYDGYNMLHHGWLGYTFPDGGEVRLGVHKVPFGLMPYAGNSWFFQLGFYVGLEDDYDLGVKYTKELGPVRIDLAYYAMSEGSWRGASSESARYSYDVVSTSSYTLSSPYEERHQGNVRVAYSIEHSEEATTELGLSLQVGGLRNEGVGDDGLAQAVALHVKGDYGGLGIKAAAIAYTYEVDDNDQNGGNPDIVVMGAFDFPYHVATKGLLLEIGLSYRIAIDDWEYLDAIILYEDYSVLLKDGETLAGRHFKASHQNVVGFAIQAGGWYTYVDLAVGNGAPFVGGSPSPYVNGLAANTSDEWQVRFNVNLGYYF